jgi:hypothetical protein
MSSEAIYFPHAMASAPETIGLGHCASEISSELLDEAQSTSDLPPHPLADVVPNVEISDELLLEQVQQGDKEALVLLFCRHSCAVRNVANRILRNDAEADDLVSRLRLNLFATFGHLGFYRLLLSVIGQRAVTDKCRTRLRPSKPSRPFSEAHSRTATSNRIRFSEISDGRPVLQKVEAA